MRNEIIKKYITSLTVAGGKYPITVDEKFDSLIRRIKKAKNKFITLVRIYRKNDITSSVFIPIDKISLIEKIPFEILDKE